MNKNKILVLMCLLILSGCSNYNNTEDFEYIRNDNISIQESETFIADGNFLMKNNNSEEQEATVMCTEITVQNDITRIVVTNGNTGEKKEINSIEEVDSILDQIRNTAVISCEKGNVQGYSYFLALYRNEDFVQSVYVSSESIQTDGMRYTVESTKDLSDSIVD